MEKYVSSLIISFFICGFAGWIWESFICPLMTGHKIKNSGFLNGPIVPIYGVGALVVSLLFSPSESYLSIFIEGAFVACVIEYFTSWAMEALYHRRWWDYDDKAFNVNGRVCLEGFLIFGLFSVIAVKFIQPTLLSMIMVHGEVPLIMLATILCAILLVDLGITITTLANLEKRIDEFVRDAEEYAQRVLDGFEQGKKSIIEILETIRLTDSSAYQEFLKQKKFAEKRILKAFPALTNKKKK